MAVVPRHMPIPSGGRPLDPERPTDDPALPTLDATPGDEAPVDTASHTPSPPPRTGRTGSRAKPPQPPGLKAQLGATRLAVVGFLRAHIELAKSELNEIKGEVARAAGLAALAIAVVILASLLVAIGGILVAGEWIFGSIGWGVLLGTELLLAVAVTAGLVALRVPGLGKDLLIALLPGIAVGLILGFNLPNALFAAIGDATNLGVDPAVRPLVVGLLLVGLVGALAGLVLGARAGGPGAGVGGLVAGFLLGALVGAFLAITFGPRVSAALGVATFLVAWPILMALRTQRQGIDLEALKARFYPALTIDTTKESIEWAKARVQREPRS